MYREILQVLLEFNIYLMIGSGIFLLCAVPLYYVDLFRRDFLRIPLFAWLGLCISLIVLFNTNIYVI